MTQLWNVSLISNLQADYLNKINNAVTQSVLSGGDIKDLAAQIKEIAKVSEKRAALIARDQTSKFNAALTQARHEDLGVKKYMWSTAGDERVRDSHAEKDGQIFEYANPPEDTGHPGHDINCRCVQIAVFDEVHEKKINEQSANLSVEPDVSSKNKSGKMELGELFDNSATGSGNKSFSNLGVVSEELVKVAKENIGLDISDWQHSIDESSIRHILKRHGNEKVENERGQRAVTKADILLLPLIIKAFDSIEYTGTTESGNESFLIRKEIDDEIFSVQEIRKRHKKVAVKTMWIRKKKKSHKST
ncbi:phage head morphogenesis protein [Rodentibacter ratti]|uniref:Phage head morphogenesis protein n=2 Tax=Rodentibacter ratti TaxID=1906745 RepID=A0A1V3L3F3_9PAST|nr:phage head morphogenesis protein [Rodentibacter ratti]